jgi:hypothetical protein
MSLHLHLLRLFAAVARASQLFAGCQDVALEPARRFLGGARLRGAERQPPAGAGWAGRCDADGGRRPFDAPCCRPVCRRAGRRGTGRVAPSPLRFAQRGREHVRCNLPGTAAPHSWLQGRSASNRRAPGPLHDVTCNLKQSAARLSHDGQDQGTQTG